MSSRIRHIAIIVPDAEEAAKFYERALGLGMNEPQAGHLRGRMSGLPPQ